MSDTAPCSPIDAAFAVRGLTLGLQRSYRCGRGKTVQGHIDQHGVTAAGGGSGCGFEALPVAAAGIVDVDVGIDEAGGDGCVAEVVGFVASRYLGGRNDGLDSFAFDEDRRRTEAFGSYDVMSDEGLQTQDVSSLKGQAMARREDS